MVCQEDTCELVVHDRHLNGYAVCSDVIDEPMVCQEDTRELAVHDRQLNGYVVCSDVIDEPVVCQEDTRELVVHDSVLVNASCIKEVQYRELVLEGNQGR